MWDKMDHWDLVLPPSRPSAIELQKISSLIQRTPSDKPIAVLGSTPEFLDLLYELGRSNVYVLEKNMDFLQVVSRLRVYENREHVIEGDWLATLPNYAGQFSLILSDLTMGNIPYDDRKQFYELITTALAPGGLFYDKVLTHHGPNHRVGDLVKKYSQLPLNLLHVNYFSCEMLFCSELIETTEVVDSSRLYGELSHTITNKRVAAFVQGSKCITPEGCRWYYGRPWNLLESDYCPALSRMVVDDDEPGSPYYGRLKLFVLARS